MEKLKLSFYRNFVLQKLRFTETSFYKTTASIKQQLYTPKTKFQGIMFSKSFYHFLFSWQTPIKNYPHNCTYGGVYFTTIFLKPNPN
nr:hypothetical protein [Helicobacter pylori]